LTLIVTNDTILLYFATGLLTMIPFSIDQTRFWQQDNY